MFINSFTSAYTYAPVVFYAPQYSIKCLLSKLFTDMLQIHKQNKHKRVALD